MVYLLLNGVLVSIFVLLVSSIRVQVSVASQARSLILPAVEGFAVISI